MPRSSRPERPSGSMLSLWGIAGTDCPIPDIGVRVSADGLTLDYRMGAGWGPREVESLLELLRQLRALGGTISVPWWGAEAMHRFHVALGTA